MLKGGTMHLGHAEASSSWHLEPHQSHPSSEGFRQPVRKQLPVSRKTRMLFCPGPRSVGPAHHSSPLTLLGTAKADCIWTLEPTEAGPCAIFRQIHLLKLQGQLGISWPN